MQLTLARRLRRSASLVITRRMLVVSGARGPRATSELSVQLLAPVLQRCRRCLRLFRRSPSWRFLAPRRVVTSSVRSQGSRRLKETHAAGAGNARCGQVRPNEKQHATAATSRGAACPRCWRGFAMRELRRRSAVGAQAHVYRRRAPVHSVSGVAGAPDHVRIVAAQICAVAVSRILSSSRRAYRELPASGLQTSTRLRVGGCRRAVRGAGSTVA